jgi:phenylpyruvate tautomerase PptA (4-oxalocrotonate tautomerase family)
MTVYQRNPDDAEAWVRSWLARSTTRSQSNEALVDRISDLSAEASGVDGAVRVTVTASGALTGLWLDERIHTLTAAELAHEILAAMHRAQARLVAQVADVVTATVGAGSESGRSVVDAYRQRFPAEDGDDQS